MAFYRRPASADFSSVRNNKPRLSGVCRIETKINQVDISTRMFFSQLSP
jgi:hypothetical protein